MKGPKSNKTGGNYKGTTKPYSNKLFVGPLGKRPSKSR